MNMTKEDFIERGQWLYGRHGWQTQLAEEIGLTRKSIGRYVSGEVSIPRRVELALDALTTAKKDKA